MVIKRFRLPAPVSGTVFHLTSLLRRQSKFLNPALRLFFSLVPILKLVVSPCVKCRLWHFEHYNRLLLLLLLLLLQGSPLNRFELRAVRLNRCHMCVILTTNQSSSDDPTIVDKESILCSLNIKTMNFHYQQQLQQQYNNGDDNGSTTVPYSKKKGITIIYLYII